MKVIKVGILLFAALTMGCKVTPREQDPMSLNVDGKNFPLLGKEVDSAKKAMQSTEGGNPYAHVHVGASGDSLVFSTADKAEPSHPLDGHTQLVDQGSKKQMMVPVYMAPEANALMQKRIAAAHGH
jgi:hypothetical protein